MAFIGARRYARQTMDETRPRSDPKPPPHRADTPRPDSNASILVDSAPGERFAPGTIIAGRYRIVSPLGHGGMGEVYRADDQRLSSSVALKFLPPSKSLDPVWRDRLLREVKVAREVTHPNVCRVYDLAEHEGQYFLSMEYIDGEDLSSLLRRIGRFPEDKALEIARQICFGLGAAHEEGVLHRDLKPANVMLDGRGRIKIADFGLAALTDRIEGPEARSGTIAYMAPEQSEGREVTRQSDIYSLGLVLYEVFTGKPYDSGGATFSGVTKHKTTPHKTTPHASQSAHSGHHHSHAPSSHFVLDPAISRVLIYCLKVNPAERPASCFAVAAMLPGGDPLQAMLAAGETPSPEMVAEAGGSGAFPKRLLTAALVLFFVGILASCWLWDRRSLATVGNLTKSPEALKELSKQAIHELGYTGDAADSVWWLNSLPTLARYYGDVPASEEFHKRLKAEQPATWRFSYRQSSGPLSPSVTDFTTFDDDIPTPLPGDVLVKLSGSGRLLSFRAKTGRWIETARATTQSATSPSTTAPMPTPLDVSMLARLTGLPVAEMRAVPPIVHSGEQVDERFAWVGKYPEPNDLPVRVEVARLAGKIITIDVLAPWDLPADEQAAVGYQMPAPHVPFGAAFFNRLFTTVATGGWVLYLALIVASSYLAVRHVWLEVADLRGGFRLAVFVFVVASGCWILWTHFPPDALGALAFALSGLGSPAVEALVIFAIYIALEPFVRSHWPEKLIGWSRILDARHRDRLVAGEILIGLAAGSVARIATAAFYSPLTNPVISTGEAAYESFFHAIARFGWQGLNGVLLSLSIIFTVALMRKWVGKPWLSFVLAFPIIFVLMTYGYNGSASVLGFVGFVVPVLVIMATLARWGLLALVVCCCASNALSKIPIALSSDAYWFTWTAMMVGAVGLLAVFAYQRAIPQPRRAGPNLSMPMP